MILPDGYSDVPAGKIAAVVTHLEMTERPALVSSPRGPWTLRKVERPDLAWYRDLYRRVGEEWLWFSRIRAADDRLAARLHHPLVETHALVSDGRDEGLLEFRRGGRLGCEKCYEAMSPFRTEILEKAHAGKSRHVGRGPGRAGEEAGRRDDLDALQRRLKAAVDSEAYEEAARLRDRIRKLEEG